jgi:hypothetical protein
MIDMEYQEKGEESKAVPSLEYKFFRLEQLIERRAFLVSDMQLQ